MKKTPLLLALLCATVLLTSCMIPTDRTMIRVSTIPAGALIVNSEGKILGQEPMNVEWRMQGLTAIAPNVWQTTSLTAVWPSGAKATTNFTYSGKMFQYGLRGTIQRNIDDPNLQVDMANAARVEQLRQQQRMADAIETDVMMRSMQPPPPVIIAPPPRHHRW